jgi:DNA-binding transcriptional LysR family regulator
MAQVLADPFAFEAPLTGGFRFDWRRDYIALDAGFSPNDHKSGSGQITMVGYPLVEIQLQHEVSGAAFEKVRDGQLDASFYYGELSHPAVAGVELREITYRIVAPAAWKERIEHAGWKEIAEEPWIMTPAISTHNQLASTLFREHEITPAKVVEVDDEVVVSSLVVSGLGMALMREDLAFEKAGAGEVYLWKDDRLKTSLQFIFGSASRIRSSALSSTFSRTSGRGAPPTEGRAPRQVHAMRLR